MPDLKKEYAQRINRVMDYIEIHLDEDLSLPKLSEIACFSPYHFHRIFSAMRTETLSHFIKRLRLEKAAILLKLHDGRTVTDIALSCGFSGSAVFARAFQEAYGMSASAWRKSKDCQTDGNAGKTESKYRKAEKLPPVYIEVNNTYTQWRVIMTEQKQFTVNIEDMPETPVAYVRHTGPYKGDPTLFEGLIGRLCGWAGPRGLLGQKESSIIVIYHDNPEVTDDSKLRISVCIPVPADTIVDGEIGKLSIPAGKYAFARFELKTDEYQAAWNAVYGAWLPQSGFQPDDRPCFERYLNDPKDHPEGKSVVDICVPVKPM